MINTEVTDILQVIYFDITYIHTLEGFIYLALGTDARSRKILCYDAADSLELTGCLNALVRLAASVPAALLKGCIHHSDRGEQYCSHMYSQRVRDLGMQISMSAVGKCYENAGAECINGILKREFNLEAIFPTKAAAQTAIKDAIYRYNHRRPHGQLPIDGHPVRRYKPAEFFALRLAERSAKDRPKTVASS